MNGWLAFTRNLAALAFCGQPCELLLLRASCNNALWLSWEQLTHRYQHDARQSKCENKSWSGHTGIPRGFQGTCCRRQGVKTRLDSKGRAANETLAANRAIVNLARRKI
jgi:hypothetical protein